MISLNFTLELLFAVVLTCIMYVSLQLTNGSFLKNVVIYGIISTISALFLGLRGIPEVLIAWIMYCLEALPMVWIMSKLYEWADGKLFIIMSTICWFIIKGIIVLIFG